MIDDEMPAARERRYAQDGIAGLQPFSEGHILTAADLNDLVEAIRELDRRLRAIGG